MLRPGSRRRASLVVAVLGGVLLAGCTSVDGEGDDATERAEQAERSAEEDGPRGTVTLAFAGDVHFEGALASLPGEPDSTLGAMSRTLREADVAMVNLEGALTSVGSPTRKELEAADNRYWFRAPPASLGVLERSGVDVVTVANNHGADFGEAGLRQTIEIADDSPVAVIGAGSDRAEAFAPYRQEVRGTDVAVFTADASMRESADAIWASGEGGPGLASARAAPARNLLRAVRDEADDDDLVVVYLHWGEEGESCPTEGQRVLAESLAEAGADVVVGSHTHVLMGSGMLDDTYVNYGLANFAWYHGRRPDTGVLRLRVTDGRVADEDWLPGRTPLFGGPAVPLVGEDRTAGMQRQARARGCTDLEPAPGAIGGEPAGGSGDDASDEADGAEEAAPELPAYAARVRRVDADLRDRMTGVSHDPETCPVALTDLRYLTVRHVDFDGEVRTGEIVVAAEVADDVVDVFRELYRARWPIARMRLVDDYDGDDDASMAANNSSGYNCRVVAGSDNLSDHAFGKAIDLNPIQNPYVLPDGVVPPAGRRFADVDRSPGARPARGVIRDQDVVVRAFEAAGWEWGDGFADYQHFSTD